MGFLKSKTLWFGASTVLLGFFEKFDITNFEAFIPDAYEPLVVSFIGLVVIVLRLVTNKPVSEK